MKHFYCHVEQEACGWIWGFLPDTGQHPLARLDNCDTLLQGKNDGAREPGAHETLSVPHDNVAAKDFALRGTEGC